MKWVVVAHLPKMHMTWKETTKPQQILALKYQKSDPGLRRGMIPMQLLSLGILTGERYQHTLVMLSLVLRIGLRWILSNKKWWIKADWVSLK